MAAIRHGSVTVFFDLAEMAKGKSVKFRHTGENGESVDILIKGMDLLGAFAKMTAIMTKDIDVLQRELERCHL